MWQAVAILIPRWTQELCNCLYADSRASCTIITHGHQYVQSLVFTSFRSETVRAIY